MKIKTDNTSSSSYSEDSSRACSKIKEDEFGPVLADFRSKLRSSSREPVRKIKKEQRESADESKIYRSKGSSLKDDLERLLLRKRRRSSSVASDGKSRRYRKGSRHSSHSSRHSSSRQRSRRSTSRRIHDRSSSKEKIELSVYSDGSEIEFIEEVTNKNIQGKNHFV